MQVLLLFVCLILLAGTVCEMSSHEMQKNQQSAWLFARMLFSCFEYVFVFILINPPVSAAAVMTKHPLFSIHATTQIYLMEVKGGNPEYCSSVESGYFPFSPTKYIPSNLRNHFQLMRLLS